MYTNIFLKKQQQQPPGSRIKRQAVQIGPEQSQRVDHLWHIILKKKKGNHVGIQQTAEYKAQAGYWC